MSQDHYQAVGRADSNSPAPLTQRSDPRGIVVPDDVGLLTAEFSRRGADLAIGSPDAPALVILDYFVADTPADLMTSGGAVVPGRVVDTLAGPDASGAALPGPSSDAQPIGHVEQFDGQVVIVHGDGTRVIADQGTPLFQDDVVTTDGNGAVGIRFIDGMTLSLGSDARMVLDEFAYNPAANIGGGVIDVIQGAFSFISGKAAHVGLDSLVIDTPTMTIGIRGTKVVANAAAEGETTTVALLPEDDGTVGKIMISTEAGHELIEDAFAATTVTSRFLPPAPQTFVAPEWVYAKFSLPLAYLPPELPGGEHSPPPTDRTDLQGPDQPHEEALLGEQLPPREWLAPTRHGAGSGHAPEPATLASVQRDQSGAIANDSAPAVVPAPDLNQRSPVPLAPYTGQPDDSGGGAGGNQAPMAVAGLAPATAAEDGSFSYDVSASFADPDVGDTLTFSATLSGGAPLPAWLAIDAATGILSGTPLNADVGVLDVEVTATDGVGASAASTFQLTVTNTNDAPVVVTPIPNESPTVGLVYTYDTSSSFADPDIIHGDSLSYSAQLVGGLPLPLWLTIDPSTGVLSGIPAVPDLGIPFNIEVTATDTAGASVTTSFQLIADSSNNAPVLDATPNPTLTAIIADTAGPAGNSVAQIIVDGSIIDPDGSPVEAMAVTGVDDSNGTWQYSTDGGASWNAVGAVSDSAALLLDASANLRFVPDPGFTGSASFTFRAWDMTAGASGDSGVDVSVNGGITAYSAATDTASITVLAGSPDFSAGAEFQVNSATAKEQQTPTVAALSDGGFVTVWQSKDQDGDAWGVYGQRYDATGNAVGAEFRVNTTTTKEQQSPSVAAVADGGFVVTWQSKDRDGDNWGIYGQRYDAAGNATSAEFQVNTYTTKEQESPSVAALADGGFVVTWQSHDQDGDNWGVYGQRYDAAGNTMGAEFQVNTYTTKEQQSPAVAALADGGFVVTWQSHDQDGDNWGVYGQRYDAAGNAAGAEFQVNTTTVHEQQNPSVAALADGGFVVAWESKDQDGNELGVYGQRYDAAGNAVEFEFQVNTEFDKHQQDPTVVGLADGGFLISWQSKDQDGNNWGVFGQQFDSDGDRIGTEFQINTTASGAQTDPAMAVSADGGLMAAWTSPDANSTGVSGHIYQSETASVSVTPPSVAATSMLDFGGTSSYVDAGDPGLSANALDPGTGDFTAEAWFFYAGANGTQTILAKGNATELDPGFSIFLDGSELVVRIATEFGADAAAASVTMPGAQGWYHVAMAVDQEAGVGASQVTGYLNGSSIGWTPGYGAVPGDSFSTFSGGIETSDSFTIGAADSGGTTSGYFDAQIADVRIWNTARSLSEVQADLGRSLNGNEDHLIANWKLDEGLGGTARDAAAGGHDGTIKGGPAWQPTDSLSVVQDGTLSGRISATDPEGDTLTFSLATGPSNGSAAIDPQTGTWTYNPNAGYTGADSVSYQVADGHGGSDTVNVAITVTP